MSPLKSRSIAGSASILLDALRLGASLLVVYRHAAVMWFPSLAHDPHRPGDAAHAAVVVFFVLSGYVIAHTTSGPDRGPLHYAQARLSRLYSVVLPALVLTAIAEFIVAGTAPALSAEYTRGMSWPRYLVTGGFLNESWFLSAAPPINEPLWSLSFEFWYYAIFGLWLYRKPTLKGFVLPAVGCLVAGPKILLMMPLWLAGAIAYKMPRPRLAPAKAWVVVGGGMLLAAGTAAYLPPFPGNVGYAPLFFANQFLTDWGIGFFIAVALWSIPSEAETQSATPSAWAGKFRRIADLTFPLYVLHFPLLILWRALFGLHLHDVKQLAQALAMVLILSAVLGMIMEKQRPAWSRFFKRLLTLVYPAAQPASPYAKQSL